jgi:hypothetical protein
VCGSAASSSRDRLESKVTDLIAIEHHDWAARAATHVLAILCFRALPIVVCFVAMHRVKRLQRFLVGAAYAGLAFWGAKFGAFSLHSCAVLYAYLLVASLLFYKMPPAVRRRTVTRPGLFVLGCAIFLVAPMLILPHPAKPFALVLGWDLMLSGYSYCVSVAEREPSDAPTLSKCLFFLLVNPVLVYPLAGRAVRQPGFYREGFRRCAIGLVALAFSSAVMLPLSVAAQDGHFGVFSLPESSRPIVFGPLRFLAEYGSHAGLAALQIGLMGQLGYDLPERYNRPLLATSPLDFWRRWNTYVGEWARRYVFWPISVRAGRARLLRGGRTALAVSVVATFAFTGVLHDAAFYFGDFVVSSRGTLTFLAASLFLLCWIGLGGLLRRLTSNQPSGNESALGILRMGTVRVAFWSCTIMIFTLIKG